MCDGTVETFYYLYFCLIGMALFGTIMVALRVSWQDVDKDQLLEQNKELNGDAGTARSTLNGGSPKSSTSRRSMMNGKSAKKGYYEEVEDDHIEMTTNFGPDDNKKYGKKYTGRRK